MQGNPKYKGVYCVHADIAKVATDNGDKDMADTKLEAYVDDLAGRGDTEEEITKTRH